MTHLTVAGMVVAACLVMGCGSDETKPVTRIDVNDLRESQARTTAPGPQLLEPMRDPQGPGRIIYEPPVNLALHAGDSLVTAPFGITAAPDSAGRSPTAPAPDQQTPARRQDTARQDTAQQADTVRQQDTARRQDTGRGQDTARRPQR